MRGEQWTDSRVALLKKLWAKGDSAEAIGAQLGGVTRSAVLGKVFRLRLDHAETTPSEKPPGNVAAPRAKSAGPTWRRRGARRDKFEIAAAANRKGRSLLELTNECCRWPHGRPATRGFFFCGAPGADMGRGVPYCPRHMKRAYVADAPALIGSRGLPAGAAAAPVQPLPRRDQPIAAKTDYPPTRQGDLDHGVIAGRGS